MYDRLFVRARAPIAAVTFLCRQRSIVWHVSIHSYRKIYSQPVPLPLDLVVAHLCDTALVLVTCKMMVERDTKLRLQREGHRDVTTTQAWHSQHKREFLAN